MTKTKEEQISRIIAANVQSVCDWDDRTSPDDYPEHLLITPAELSELLEGVVDAALSVQPAAAVVGEPVARPTYQQVKDTVQANINRMHQAGESHLMMARWLSADLDKLYPAPCPETIQTYYERQIEWSRETFGPALRTKGVLDHIRKELGEIEQEPHDLSEWVDVVILAMDGFWRHGGKAADLLPALLAKQKKNMARTWPDWRTMGEDRAIEHDRSKDAALGGASHE